MPCSNKHGVNCGDDLPVLEQTDDVDASFDNNNNMQLMCLTC